MTFSRIFVPAFVLALFAVPAHAEYTRYSQLRQDNPVIDEVVGELSSSDLHGTFNRISALFSRSQVRDLPAGSFDADLPENVQRNLRAALQDLGQDLLAANEDLAASGLTGDELLHRQWVLVQVVDLVFADRMLDLSAIDLGNGATVTCGSSQFDVQCPYTASEATETLDTFLDELIREPGTFDLLPLQNWLADVRDSALAEDGFNEFGNGGLDPRDFSPRVQRLQTTSPLIEGNARVHGVPSIDP